MNKPPTQKERANREVDRWAKSIGFDASEYATKTDLQDFRRYLKEIERQQRRNYWHTFVIEILILAGFVGYVITCFFVAWHIIADAMTTAQAILEHYSSHPALHVAIVVIALACGFGLAKAITWIEDILTRKDDDET